MLQSLVHRIVRGLSIGTSSVAVFLAATLLFAASASADPSTSINIDGIDQTEKGFVVTGKVTCKGPVSGGGESHSYQVYAVADIKNSKVAKFPKLADYMVIRAPAGAETSVGPGSGPGNLMTKKERDGIDCTSIRTGPQPGTDKFKLIIPLEHAGKMVRIRAYLDYQYNNVGTPWPMIKYYHDIGHEGVLPLIGQVKIDQPHQIKITWGPQSSANPASSGQQIECTVNAQDSLGHALKYEWTTQGGSTGFNNRTLKSPTWKVPPVGRKLVAQGTITVKVYCDHGASAKGEFSQKIVDTEIPKDIQENWKGLHSDPTVPQWMKDEWKRIHLLQIEVQANLDKVAKERAKVANDYKKFQKTLQAMQKNLASIKAKEFQAIQAAVGQMGGSYGGWSSLTPEQLKIITDAGGGPSTMRLESSLVNMKYWQKQYKLNFTHLNGAKAIVATKKANVAKKDAEIVKWQNHLQKIKKYKSDLMAGSIRLDRL